MPVRNLTIDRDASIISNSTLGNTVDQHHPIGRHTGSGNLYRAFMKFNLDFTNVVSITSAKLKVRSTGTVHIVRSGRQVQVRRLTEALANTQGGSSEGTWSGSANPRGGAEPDATTLGQSAVTTLTPNSNTWDDIDITAIVQAWFDGQTNHGILLKANNEASGGDTYEVYSKESSYDPYIELTYVDNALPGTPYGVTVDGLASNSIVSGGDNLDVVAYHLDTDGDALSGYQYDIDATTGNGIQPDWASVLKTGTVNAPHATIIQEGPGTWKAVFSVAISGFVRGTWYALRIRTKDAIGYGPYAYHWFRVNTLPIATLTEPSAAGRLGKLSYTAGSGWASPRLNVAWTYSDPVDGWAQNKYELEVANDSGGNPTGTLIASGEVSSAAVSAVVAATLTEGNYYHVRVRVFDGREWSAWSGWYRVRVRWGLSTHRKDVSISGNAPSAWSISSVDTTTDAAKNTVVMEYNSTDDGTANLGAWKSTLASVTKRKWFHYRAWLLTWGASPGTSPSLDKLVMVASGSTITPDKWLPVPISGVGGTIEASDQVFGTQSLLIAGSGGTRRIRQQVTVQPDTDYMLQARIRSIGNSGAYVGLADSDTGAYLVRTDPLTADSDWTHKILALPWNSGARTSVWVQCVVTGATDTFGLFDALKLERGYVASPWTPGMVGDPVVVDAGGIMVDAATGGIFRLRGSTGGLRDRVELGSNGLVFGGDIQLYSPGAKRIDFGDASLKMGGTAFPTSPAAGARYFRTDLGMEFYYDGTRWLSTALYQLDIEGRNDVASSGDLVSAISATATVGRAPLPILRGGTQIWAVTFESTFIVNTGGTALSGSHKWEGAITARDLNGSTVATIGNNTIDSGASGTFRKVSLAFNGALSTSSVFLQAAWTKTGTPGTLAVYDILTYRIVAT